MESIEFFRLILKWLKKKKIEFQTIKIMHLFWDNHWNQAQQFWDNLLKYETFASVYIEKLSYQWIMRAHFYVTINYEQRSVSANYNYGSVQLNLFRAWWLIRCFQQSLLFFLSSNFNFRSDRGFQNRFYIQVLLIFRDVENYLKNPFNAH